MIGVILAPLLLGETISLSNFNHFHSSDAQTYTVGQELFWISVSACECCPKSSISMWTVSYYFMPNLILPSTWKSNETVLSTTKPETWHHPRAVFLFHRHFQHMTNFYDFCPFAIFLCYYSLNQSLFSSPLSLFFMSSVLFSFKCHQSSLSKDKLSFPLLSIPTSLPMTYRMRSKFLSMTY